MKAQTKIRVCSQLSLSDHFLSSAGRAEHICIFTGQIVKEYSEVWSALRMAGSVNNSHESESHRESEFINTRHHYIIITCKLEVVAVYEMSGTKGQEPAGTDPSDLQLPRGATGSSREQSTPQSTAPVTRLKTRRACCKCHTMETRQVFLVGNGLS